MVDGGAGCCVDSRILGGGMKKCIDCPEGTKRKTPHPGPRCATHHRQKREQRRAYNHEKHVTDTYSITYEQYWDLYRLQGGVCAICQRATGARRKLSVDHNHSCCKGSMSCGRCVRGLLCTSCNQLLGHLRDDPEAVKRALHYLLWPPAWTML